MAKEHEEDQSSVLKVMISERNIPPQLYRSSSLHLETCRMRSTRMCSVYRYGKHTNSKRVPESPQPGYSSRRNWKRDVKRPQPTFTSTEAPEVQDAFSTEDTCSRAG